MALASNHCGTAHVICQGYVKKFIDKHISTIAAGSEARTACRLLYHLQGSHKNLTYTFHKPDSRAVS